MLCASPASAQDEIPNPLTLQDALRLALERNPSVASAQADVRAREAALSGQQARRLPTLTASMTAGMQRSLPRAADADGGAAGAARGTSETSDLALTLAHSFWQSGRKEAIASGREQVLCSRASLEDTRRQLLLSVATTWHTILSQQELAAVADEAVRAAQQHLELVDARMAAGTAAPADRLPIEAELAEARCELVSTVNAVWQSLAQLQALLALPPDTLPVLSGADEVAFAAGELQTWVAEALSERPDLAAQRNQLRVAQLALRQAEIGAGLSFEVQGQAEYGRFTGTDGNTWALSAGVSFPLFDRTASAQVAQAEASLESSRGRLAELELSVTREVSQAWHALTDASERVTSAEASLAAATSTLEAAQARYALGAASVIDLTDAELTRRQAAARLVQARYDRNVAHYELLAAAGRLLTEGQSDHPDAQQGAREAVAEGVQ
ncbi:MAG: TolC family protein [Armatimonadota bacterium]